jgi:hypothetical protein
LMFVLGGALWTAGIAYVIFLYWQYVLGLSCLTAASIALFFYSFKYDKE